MPAIRPAILRQQAALLAEYFDRPTSYIRSLHHLLEFYADHSRRSSLVGEPTPLLKSYHVPQAVLRQILIEIIPIAIEQPEVAVLLCDALWEEEYWEFRWLASALIGNLPTTPVLPIIQRIQNWMKSFPERRLYEVIIDLGCTKLRKEHEEDYLGMVGSWIASAEIKLKQVGLRSLNPLVKDQSFENLPVVFRLLQPYILDVPASLRVVVLDLIIELARRSPQETAFFLRQSLLFPQQRSVPFFIRQCLLHFPPEIQADLREVLRDAG